MPVSMLCAASVERPPCSSISYCTKTRFQYSIQRSHSQPGPQSGRPQPYFSPISSWAVQGPRAGGARRSPEVVAAPEVHDVSSVKPCDFQMSMASASTGTWSSPPKTLTLTRERGMPSWSDNSSAQAMASVLK